MINPLSATADELRALLYDIDYRGFDVPHGFTREDISDLITEKETL